MRNGKLSLLALVLVMPSSGCGRGTKIERRSPDDASSVKTYFEMLRQGEYDRVESAFDPAAKDTGFRSDFEEMVATIPAENPLGVKTVSDAVQCEEVICYERVIVEYRYSTELLLFNVLLEKEGGQSLIEGMHIRVIPDSFLEANKFTLSQKGLSQYAILTLAILFPAVSVYALILCIRSRIGPQKWIWAAFILFGVMRLGVNWTTGQLGFEVMVVQVLSAAAFAEPYQPWLISVSFPLGAILFLIYRKVKVR
jgi:hypothetical protein